jgi:hypothetical protein
VKHIKLFEDFINEFDTGSVLLGDPTTLGRPSKWEELGIKFEPNTADETELIQMIKEWIFNVKANPKMGQILKELLPLKKKFPKILEPSKGRTVYEGTSLYRGTLIPFKDVLSLKGKWTYNDTVDMFGGSLNLKTTYNWESINRKGFTSFTPSIDIAEDFAGSLSSENYGEIVAAKTIVKRLLDGSKDGMIPVIVKIKDTHPLAIMNPVFTQSVHEFMNEFEVFVIGNKIKVDEVIIPGWHYYERDAKELGLDLKKCFNI